MNIVSDAEARKPQETLTRETITLSKVIFRSFTDNPIWQSANLFNIIFNIGMLVSAETTIIPLSLLAMSFGVIGLVYNFSLTYKVIEKSILYAEREHQSSGSISN